MSNSWIAPFDPAEAEFEFDGMRAELETLRRRFDRIREIVGALPDREHSCSEASVSTPGRTQLSAFFGKSGLFEKSSWHHTQALAFIVQGQLVTVRVCGTKEALLKLPDETQVMQQWPGKWDSDWFTYSVGDLRGFLNEDDDA